MTDPTPRQPSKASQALLVGGAAKPQGELASSPWRLVAIAAGVIAVGVAFGWGWVFMIAALTVMIFLHELGHFLTAKWAGMKVTEFCILGVGPKLWSIRRGETEYMVRAIPVAAYVRIIGMNNLDDTDPADEPRTFRQQSFPKRVVVMSGGSAMHFVQAFVLFILVFAVVGVPSDMALAQKLGGPDPRWGIADLVDGGGAQKGGLRAGDELVAIAGKPVAEPDDVRPLVVHRAGDTLPVTVVRDGRQRTFQITIGHDPADPELGLMGVQVGDLPSHLQPTTRVNPARAAWESASTMGSWSWQTLRGLGSFVTGGLGDYARQVVGQDQRDDSANGPVVSSGGSKAQTSEQSSRDDNRLVSVFGVARAGADAAGSDMAQVLLLLAIVNLSIGIINLLPLLPFDGGHIAVAVYERIRSRRGRRHMADVSRLLPLTYAVVLVLGLIMVSSVYLDIVDPVGLR